MVASTAAVPAGVPTRAPQIIATGISCSILSTIFVTLRLYTRGRINRANWGWDDYAALLTLPFCIAYGALVGVSTRHGMGLHAGDMSQGMREGYQKWIFVSSCAGYLPSLLGYKMSILHLYVRIFNMDRRFRHARWAVMFVTGGYLFCNFWTQIFGCRPIAKYWRPDTPGTASRRSRRTMGTGL